MAASNFFRNMGFGLDLGVRNNINDHSRVFAMFKGVFIPHYFKPSFTVAYNITFVNCIDLCAAYTVQQSSYDNLGIGIGFRLGPVNLNLGTDNILAPMMPKRASSMSAHFGLSFNFGKLDSTKPAKREKREKKQKPAESQPKPEAQSGNGGESSPASSPTGPSEQENPAPEGE